MAEQENKQSRTMLWIGALIIIAAVLIFARNARRGQLSGAPETGQQAPKLEVESWVTPNAPDPNEISQKPYLLEFWATWCGPCVQNIPHMKDLTEKYGDKINIIAVSVDQSSDPVAKMVENKGINYHVAMDGGLSDKYGVSGIPAGFVISKDGAIIWSGHPGDEQLEKVLKNLAEEK